MFSTGQIVFALLFFAAFVSATVWMYRKDRRLHRRQYKGAWQILIAFISFVILLLALKYLLNK